VQAGTADEPGTNIANHRCLDPTGIVSFWWANALFSVESYF